MKITKTTFEKGDESVKGHKIFRFDYEAKIPLDKKSFENLCNANGTFMGQLIFVKMDKKSIWIGIDAGLEKQSNGKEKMEKLIDEAKNVLEDKGTDFEEKYKKEFDEQNKDNEIQRKNREESDKFCSSIADEINKKI